MDHITAHCSSSQLQPVQQTYTVEQIAQILNVSMRKAYYLCESTDKFIVKRIGKRCLRINKQSFDTWFNGCC